MKSKQYLAVDSPFYVIALIDAYDISVSTDSPLYERTDIAVHKYNNKLQVLITADSHSGISQFFKHYPKAEECKSGCLLNTEDWETLCFPNKKKPSPDSAPIDIYLQSVAKKNMSK